MELSISESELEALARACDAEKNFSLELMEGECILCINETKYILDHLNTSGHIEIRGVRFKVNAAYADMQLSIRVDE